MRGEGVSGYRIAAQSPFDAGHLPGLRQVVAAALAEDLGPGDLTAAAFVPRDAFLRCHIVARDPGVLAGLDAAQCAFALVDSTLDLLALAQDGDSVAPGAHVLAVAGSARAILGAERTALNFLQHLSGIATLTRAYVDAVAGTGARIFDTRKTTPGLRALEKGATKVAGAHNHRMGLYDAVMIKDNHLPLAGGMTALRARIAEFKAVHADIPVEVEADRVDQARELVGMDGVDVVLLDNMDVDELRQCVALRGTHKVLLEASGGVTLATVRAIAETGVDRISVGELTHSAPALDFGLDLAM